MIELELTQEQGEFLVRLARKTVEYYLDSDENFKPSPPKETPRELWANGGVFVTINSKGDTGEYNSLRGCIGFPYPIMPIVEATIEAAIAAATEDPRFYPLSSEELKDVVFEISVLTPPKELEFVSRSEIPSKIVVGRDGLIIEKNTWSGLLLPQVPLEYNWDSEEFLREACIKAGLHPEAWKENGTKILIFTAKVFREQEPMGKVLEGQLKA